MKAIISFSVILFWIGVLHGQKISIKQRNETIGSGNNSAFVVSIYEAPVSEIEKKWKSLMKDYDAKVTMGGEIFADNAKFKEYDNTCDVYARIKNISDKEKELVVGVDLGGTYLSGNHPSLQKKIENLMYDFSLRLTREEIANQIKDAEKVHKKLIKEKENLEDEKEQLLKDIENYKNKIIQAEKAITENEKMQETKKLEIENQNKSMEGIKDKYNSFK